MYRNEVATATVVRWICDGDLDAIGVDRGNIRRRAFASENAALGIDPSASIFREDRRVGSHICGAEHESAECRELFCSRCH